MGYGSRGNIMAEAYLLGSEKDTPLIRKPITLPALRKREVLIRHTAIGLNRVDLDMINRKIALPAGAVTAGAEGIGIVEDMGKDVHGLNIGDRVAYGTGIPGAFATHRIIHQHYLVNVPPEVSDEAAAALVRKGMTAHYLLAYTFVVREGDQILIHGVTGGVGHLLAQWCRHRGAIVHGTIGDKHKRHAAKEYGCHFVYIHTDPDWMKLLAKHVKSPGIAAVYDLLGGETLYHTGEVMRHWGIWTAVGDVAGAPPPLNPELLGPRSLLFTRPNLDVYKAHRMELILSMHEVFTMFLQEHLKPVYQSFFFEELPTKALEAFAARDRVGAVVLKC
jgi:NADPH2:quinone reductase